MVIAFTGSATRMVKRGDTEGFPGGVANQRGPEPTEKHRGKAGRAADAPTGNHDTAFRPSPPPTNTEVMKS
jgi:hypothetical protein